MYILQTRRTGALQSQMSAGATSCTLAASTFGTPSGSQIITIDGSDILKAADFSCTITGTAVTNMTLLNGVDVVHAANAPVTMNFVDEHYAALTDGSMVTAAWATWSPTLANLSGGSLNYAKYVQIGKTVFFRFKYTLGGAGVAGDVSFTLPVTANSDLDQVSYIGQGFLNNADGAIYIAFCNIKSGTSTAANIRTYQVDVINLVWENLTSTAPFTWATGDTISINGFYEAA